jgi:hypothetical protein
MQAQNLGGVALAADPPAALFQHFDDVIPLDGIQALRGVAMWALSRDSPQP